MKKYKIDNYIVKANSPFEAMKAVQTLKDSIKDAGYYWNDIRAMCIKNDWYTYGTNNEYNNLFEKATSGEWKAEQIAKDIQTHSRPDVRYEDVLREVKRLHVYDSTKDSKIKDATKSINEIAEYFRVWGYPSRSELQEVVDFYKLSKNDMKKIFGTHYDETDLIKLKYHDSTTKDAAFDRSTIDALIADEQAAIDAYNVAIANLKGKLSDEAIKVLQAIRDDEQNHVANLNAILSNNITEKNLEDSIKDAEYKAFYKGKELKRGDELVDFRGDKSYYYGCYHPRKITVSEDKAGNDLQEYYPSVFNVEIKA